MMKEVTMFFNESLPTKKNIYNIMRIFVNTMRKEEDILNVLRKNMIEEHPNTNNRTTFMYKISSKS
jgi:hypothetical protein